ncbi:MAG TPA: hypothetical protein VG708_13360 [Mycobacteriales bacterium]|jgi:hypothetical protein|nr:hypothetical protein [Mycobacteriales bacterium]
MGPVSNYPFLLAEVSYRQQQLTASYPRGRHPRRYWRDTIRGFGRRFGRRRPAVTGAPHHRAAARAAR